MSFTGWNHHNIEEALLIRLVDKTEIFIVLYWGNHIPPEYSPINQRAGTARCAVQSSQRDDPTLNLSTNRISTFYFETQWQPRRGGR